jgi:hypothetical protein
MAEGEDRFRPLRPVSRARLAVGIILGPLLWIAAFLVTSLVIEYTDAIAYGLLIATVSFMAATVLLSVLRWGRQREERRHADRR